MSSLNPFKIFPVFILHFILSNSLNLESVSDRVKRDTGIEFYPDWLPFKNLKVDITRELDTEHKTKPRKRLAYPSSFILRAVAEVDGDDYYEKGESDGEDYFDKKEWSDANRPVESIETKSSFNNENISDIDGIVSIITQSNPITEVFRRQKNIRESADSESAEITEDNIEEKVKKDDKTDDNQNEENSMEEQKSEKIKNNKNRQQDEDEPDYEEENIESKKPEISEEEKKENEIKKAKILSSVDDLKMRHAHEQRLISEKVKEEEMYKEELERDKIKLFGDSDKYSSHPKKPLEYEEYDDKEGPKDKYKVHHRKPTTKPTTLKQKLITTPKPKPKKTEKHIGSGKLSVFKNPRAYMVYDEEDSGEILTKPPTEPTRVTKTSKGKYSSKYSTPATNSQENDRISLVPEEKETKEGEPTMFFPKRRSLKRKRKPTSFSYEDSSAAESVTNKTAKDSITAFDVTAADSTAPETVPTEAGTIETEIDTAPSSTGSTTFTEETAPSAVSTDDAVPASSRSSGHKKKHHKHENYRHEKGGQKEHHLEHTSSLDEKGSKAYEGVHEDTKTEKGHHDKKNHHGKYMDHGGVDKHHHDEKKHFGSHNHVEHGKKHAKYEESGKHSKGHSTKGSHDIHKKEEYEKNVEFFEEEGDSSEEKKQGGHNHARSYSSGGHYKARNFNAGHHSHAKGDKGHADKGTRGHEQKGQQSSAGHDNHAKYGREHRNKVGKAAIKKWIYHHGSPPQTSNLVVIDRRGDPYYHGAQYYG